MLSHGSYPSIHTHSINGKLQRETWTSFCPCNHAKDVDSIRKEPLLIPIHVSQNNNNYNTHERFINNSTNRSQLGLRLQSHTHPQLLQFCRTYTNDLRALDGKLIWPTSRQ